GVLSACPGVHDRGPVLAGTWLLRSAPAWLDPVTGANSSAGSERLPYTQDVGGSNPSSPTVPPALAGPFDDGIWRSLMRRRASFGIALGALVLAAATALPVSAQLARPRVASPDAPKLLVAPFQRDNPDSALSLLIADGVRDRVRVQHLDKFNLITRQALNTVLTESGFPVDVPIERTHLVQIIRFMNAKYIIEGSMIRKPGDSVLIVARLAEATGNTPQSVSTSMMAPAGRLNSGTGAEIANRLVAGYAAFDEVAACRREVDAGNI